MYLAYFTNLTCNFQCSYCHQREQDSDKRVTHEYPIKPLANPDPIIAFLLNAPWSYRELAIMGGEATLNPNFKKIVEALHKRYFLVVTTNLAIKNFDDSFLPWAKSVKVRWNLTFHPQGIEIDEFIRRARLLKRMGHGVHQFAAVNSEHLTEEMIKKLKKQRWNIFSRFNFDLQTMCDYQNGILRPTPEEIKKEPRKIKRQTGITLENYSKYKLYCGQGKEGIYTGTCKNDAFLIGPNGNIFMCHSHLYNNRNKIGNIKDKIYKIDQPRDCDTIGLCNQCDFRGIHNNIKIQNKT